MSLFKGRMDSGGEFTAQDDVRGLRLIAPGALPSYWSVECGDGVDWYFWVNDSDELIMDNSAPTSTYDSVGNIVTGAGNSGANVTLSNLGTTAIAAHVLTATDSTYNLGGTNYWANAYIDKVYVHSAATITGGAADRIDFVGDEYHGVDTAGATVIWYATATGSKLTWDDTSHTNEGSLNFTTSARLTFGDSAQFLIWEAGNSLEIDPSTDNYVLNFGATKDLDVIFHGKAGDDDAGWDASVETFQIMDNAIFHIGGTSIGSQAVGVKFVFDGTATLNIDAITAEDSITIGETTSTDFELHGTAYDIHWDASVDDLIFADGVGVILGSNANVRFDSADPLVTVTYGGTDNGLILSAYAAQTVAALHIDGATNDWDGATGVGMLTLSSDTALAHAAATNLLVTHATTAPITDADGFLARFVSTATARTNAYAVDIVVPVTQPALRANSIVQILGVNTANAAVLQVTGNDATNDVNAVTINNEGSDYALKVTGDDADSGCITTLGVTSQTASQIYLDGTVGAAGFIGAAGVGMLALKQDGGTLADATASLIHVDFDGTAAATHKGTCLHIDDDAAGGSGFAAYISAAGSTEALWVDDGGVTFDETLTVTGATTQTGQLIHTPSVLHGLSVLGIARAIYEFGVDGGVVGEVTLTKTATIPDNAILVGGSVHVTDAATSGGAMNIAFGTTAGSAADSILAATAKASLGADAMLNSDITFAAPVKMTAPGDISVTVETTDATAGDIEIVVLYYVAAA